MCSAQKTNLKQTLDEMKKQILSKTGGALALGMVIAAASNSAEAAVTVGSTA